MGANYPVIKPRNAFTFIELFVVIAIMVSMMTLLIFSFASIGKSGALNGGGALVAGLANAARQNSLSKNAMTALVIVTDPSIDSQNRMFTILELVPSSSGHSPSSADWTQISKWETLAPGIVVSNWTTQTATSSTIAPAFPNLSYGGKSIGQFKALVFMPDGSTYSDSPTTVELVEGYFPPGATTPLIFSHSKNGTAADYYKLTILNATGRIKIDRP